MLPAPGQGALAVECRDVEDDVALLDALRDLDDPDTRAAVTAERSLLATLEAGCSAPVGAHATVTSAGGEVLVHLTGVVVSLDGRSQVRKSVTGTPATRSVSGASSPSTSSPPGCPVSIP